MAYDYSVLEAKAMTLLIKYGSAVEVIAPNQSVLSTVSGVNGDTSDMLKSGSAIQDVDVVFYLPSDAVGVQQDNYLRVDGEIYKIVKVIPVKPGPTLMLYEVYGSK
jgi:hypothetical protein